MNIKKFYSAFDAAKYAATLTDSWIMEDGDIMSEKDIRDLAICADGENPLDEGDDDNYYLVDENGAIGLTCDDCNDIYWWMTPEKIVSRPEGSGFCPNCGAAVKSNWAFCQKCGSKL